MNEGWLWALIAYVIAPCFIAMRVLRADRRETLNAFCIFWGILLFLGMLWGSTMDEKLGWPLILGMLWSTIAIPIIVLICRLFRLRLPWFA